MTSCHDLAINEPLIGTAPQRRVWLIIEQPGAWGEDALTQSDLPAGFGADLKAAVTDPEIGLALARRPDLASHERRSTRRRRLWLAHTSPGGVRMRAGSLDDIRDVLRWDFAAIKRGELPPVGRRSADPALFICTNGKKDKCCATEGRQVIDALRPDAELTGQLYEISHLGGHRFAPTALLLPWGYLYGRLNAQTAREALALAWEGKTLTQQLRGRSAFPSWAQIAEIAVRNEINEHPVDALDVVVRRGERILPWTIASSPEPGDEVEVRHADGRAWSVELAPLSLPARPTSCDGQPTSADTLQAVRVSQLANWHN